MRRITAAARWLWLLALPSAPPALPASASPTAAPPEGPALAWIRFEGAAGAETYRGTPYLFLGRLTVDLESNVRPAPGHRLAVRWGAKNDIREGTATVNGQAIPLRGDGYDGFRWLTVDVPAKATGDRYRIRLAAAGGTPGFIAEVRLHGAGAPGEAVPDPAPAAHRMTLRTAPAEPPATGADARGEAFPDQRPLWDTPRPAPERPDADAAAEAAYRRAEANGRRAAEALYRCRRFVDGWLAYADPETGLIPRNLRESRDVWNGRDAAADNYPFMVLTCAFTDRARFEGRMLDMLRTETRLTSRVGRIPDDYAFSKKGWRRDKVDLDVIIFDGAEYVKDGLIPITEWLGPSPWSARAIGIIDDIWKHAPIETPFGTIPTHNFEVNGDLLQACSRLFWLTGERKYLDWAIRLGDYYLLGDHHPTRDLGDLKLGDHSCEVINGLSELYVAAKHAAPEKKAAYEKPLHELYDRLLEIGRDEQGFFYLHVDNRTGKPKGTALTDNWGYNYDGIYTAYRVDGTPAYRDAVRKVLSNLKAHHTGKGGMCQSNTADGYADSIEGALTLLNREPDASAAEWVDTEIRTMWGKQKADGVIEGWHGDGNSARTSILYALWKSQGAQVQPWRADVRLGAVRDGDAVLLSVAAGEAWSGRIVFDRPRHRDFLHLPLDYPRINQFPEWFTVESERRYTVRDAVAGTQPVLTGRALQEGLPVELKAGEERRLRVAPAGP
jgi:hypothetical protein